MRDFRANAPIHAAFLLTGMVTTMLGAVLPVLSARWSLNDAQAGRLFTAQFLGALVGSLASSRLMGALGSASTMALGVALMAIGAAGCNAAGAIAGTAAICCYGFGIGLAVPAGNLVVAARNPGRRAAALNVLNFVWCVGAVMAPYGIAALMWHASGNAFFVGLAVLLAICAAAVFLLNRRADAAEGVAAEIAQDRVLIQFWKNPVVLLSAALLFFYVGTENGFGGWIASYGLREHQFSAAWQATAQSVFWSGILSGRLIGVLALRRLTTNSLLLIGMAIAMVGITVFLAASGASGVFVGAALAGIGLATVFPTAVAAFSESAGADASRYAAFVFAVAELGGAIIPWCIGFVSTRLGNLRIGMLAPLVCILVMIGVQLWVMSYNATNGGPRSREA